MRIEEHLVFLEEAIKEAEKAAAIGAVSYTHLSIDWQSNIIGKV